MTHEEHHEAKTLRSASHRVLTSGGDAQGEKRAQRGERAWLGRPQNPQKPQLGGPLNFLTPQQPVEQNYPP